MVGVDHSYVTLPWVELLYIGIHVDASVTIGIVLARRSALVQVVAPYFVILVPAGNACLIF